MRPKELNTLETFFKILDKFYPDWEKRADDYYLTEIAFLILKVFNSPYTDETIINNLRVMNVSKYNDELAKIYALPLEAYTWIMQNRMKPDRAKASVKRYVKNAMQRNGYLFKYQSIKQQRNIKSFRNTQRLEQASFLTASAKSYHTNNDKNKAKSEKLPLKEWEQK